MLMILGGVVLERDRILAVKAGNDAAFAEMCRDYAPLIDSMTEKYCNIHEGSRDDKEDLRQEASVAFYWAVMTYDTEQTKVTFGLYAKICIRNRMISLLRKSRSDKKRAQSMAAHTVSSPSGNDIDREALLAVAGGVLSDFEKTVFFMYIGGKSYRDIASSLGTTVKSVDNALFRAKTKVRSGYSD